MRDLITLSLAATFFWAVAPAGAQPQAGTVLWKFDEGTPITSSPALGLDGTVYVVAGSSVCAVTNSGSAASNKWTLSAYAVASPSVGADGTVYFGDSTVDCNIRALDPDGSSKWTLALQPEFQEQIRFRSCPAVAWDGMLHFVAGGRLYGVSSSGIKKWEAVVDDSSALALLSPCLGTDRTIYVGSWWNRMLYAISPAGTQNWASVVLASNCSESQALGWDGTVYTPAGQLYAFNKLGTNLWAATADRPSGPPVVGSDGTVYVSSYPIHVLYAISPAGQVVWQALGDPFRYAPATAPAIDAGSRIYYCASNSVWALSAQGQVLWAVTAPTIPPPGSYYNAATSPIIGPDGTIYAALGTVLYAIASATNGPANSPWPMYQQNARHTGKVEKPSLQQPKKRRDANLRFELYAQIGQTQTVQTSTDLATWTSLTNVAVTNIPTDVVDLSASNFPSRFYRTVSQ
jgi:hypothetical protein